MQSKNKYSSPFHSINLLVGEKAGSCMYSNEGSKTYQMQSGRDEQVAEMAHSHGQRTANGSTRNYSRRARLDEMMGWRSELVSDEPVYAATLNFKFEATPMTSDVPSLLRRHFKSHSNLKVQCCCIDWLIADKFASPAHRLLQSRSPAAKAERCSSWCRLLPVSVRHSPHLCYLVSGLLVTNKCYKRVLW